MKRRWRVRVCEGDYGCTGVVIVTRRRSPRSYQHGIQVAQIDLAQPDAEEQIADARARAASLARSLNGLEAA